MKESRIEATDRLRRENRWGEASQYRDEVRQRLRSEGESRREASDEAWGAMLEQFPPLPTPPTAPNALDLSDADESLIERLAAVEVDVVRDVSWVYSHAAHPRLTLADAPSLAAWGLLKFARAEPQKFFFSIAPRVLKSNRAGAAAEDEAPDSDPGLADLKRMIAAMNA